MPYWGMNRKEVWGLLALIAVSALGFGVQATLRAQREGAVWVEHGAGLPDADEVSESNLSNSNKAGEKKGRLEDRKGFPERPAKPLPSAGSKAWRTDGRLDLNRAESADLETLTRIGPARARDILAYRQSHGGFRSARELLEVPGIGEKTWQTLEPLVYVEPTSSTAPTAATVAVPSATVPGSGTIQSLQPTPPLPPSPSPRSTPSPSSQPPSPSTSQKIDLNRATGAELESLWNIGPQKAQAIVQWRQTHGGFKRVEDFLEVPGIGPQTLARNRDRLVVTPFTGEAPKP
jgi:competence ComEA-like helix-hairpin-helix protein